MRVPHHLHTCRLRRVSGFAAISILGLGLAGCFTSKEPLIAVGASDHSLAVGTRFILFCADAREGGIVGWQTQKRGLLRLPRRL
jgi:hypothetical protein